MNKLKIQDLGKLNHDPKLPFVFTSTKDGKGKKMKTLLDVNNLLWLLHYQSNNCKT